MRLSSIQAATSLSHLPSLCFHVLRGAISRTRNFSSAPCWTTRRCLTMGRGLPSAETSAVFPYA